MCRDHHAFMPPQGIRRAMRAICSTLTLAALLLTGCGDARVDINDASFFPLQRGTYWLCDNLTIEQSAHDYRVLITNRTVQRVEIVDACATDGAMAALVSSDPGWGSGEPGQPCVLLRPAPGRYYVLPGTDWNEICQRVTNRHDSLFCLVDEERLLIDAPFAVGKRYGEHQQLSRRDAFYCWQVNDIRHVPVKRVRGVSPLPRRECVELLFRTNPDHTIMTFVPGIGITSHESVHHGSVMERYQRLIEFGAPPRQDHAVH